MKTIFIDEQNGYPLPDLLTEKRPYKNIVTEEIRYLNMYEKYGLYVYSKIEHDNYEFWKPIPDSLALRLLYGPKTK